MFQVIDTVRTSTPRDRNTMPTDTSNRPTVREAFLRLMRDLGIDTVFGNRGSTEAPMFPDFPKDIA